MTDPDIVNRLQADAIFFGTRQEPLLVDHSVCREMAECWESAADEIERLRAELVSVTNKLQQERDELCQAWLEKGRIMNEIDCRIEHGADSNGHLEAIRNLFSKQALDKMTRLDEEMGLL